MGTLYFELSSAIALKGIPWQSSGQDITLPLQGKQVRSLVGELRSYVLCGTAKKIKNKMALKNKVYQLLK